MLPAAIMIKKNSKNLDVVASHCNDNSEKSKNLDTAADRLRLIWNNYDCKAPKTVRLRLIQSNYGRKYTKILEVVANLASLTVVETPNNSRLWPIQRNYVKLQSPRGCG